MKMFRRLYMYSFWLPFVLIIFSGNVSLYAEQEVPENIADTVTAWINNTRSLKGLEKLSVDPRLNRAAVSHSEKMSEYNILSDSGSDLGTPLDRLKSLGLTDINSLVAVAKAETPELLLKQLESPENISKILSSEMTNMGVGVKRDTNGGLWLTVHMTERAVAFTQFTLSKTDTDPAGHSITVKGNTPYNKIEVVLIPLDKTNPDLAVDRVITPDANRCFEVTLYLGTETGSFDFEFYVEKDGGYQLKNIFSLGF